MGETPPLIPAQPAPLLPLTQCPPREGGCGLPPALGSLTWAPRDLATQDPRPPHPTIFPEPTARPAPSSVRPCSGETTAGSGPRGAPGSLAATAHTAHISNPARVRVDGRPQPPLPACAQPRAEPRPSRCGARTPRRALPWGARCSWGLALIPDRPAASSPCSDIPRLPRVPGPQSGYYFLTETPGEQPRGQPQGQPCLPPQASPLGVVFCPPPLLGGPWPPLPAGLISAPSPPGHQPPLRSTCGPRSILPPAPVQFHGQPHLMGWATPCSMQEKHWTPHLGQCPRSVVGMWPWLTLGHWHEQGLGFPGTRESSSESGTGLGRWDGLGHEPCWGARGGVGPDL